MITEKPWRKIVNLQPLKHPLSIKGVSVWFSFRFCLCICIYYNTFFRTQISFCYRVKTKVTFALRPNGLLTSACMFNSHIQRIGMKMGRGSQRNCLNSDLHIIHRAKPVLGPNCIIPYIKKSSIKHYPLAYEI